jgi:hypothetical protein
MLGGARYPPLGSRWQLIARLFCSFVTKVYNFGESEAIVGLKSAIFVIAQRSRPFWKESGAGFGAE